MSFRILFMGTPSFAVPIFDQFTDQINSRNILNHQKKDRGLKMQNSPIHNFAIKKIFNGCPNSLEENEELLY